MQFRRLVTGIALLGAFVACSASNADGIGSSDPGPAAGGGGAGGGAFGGSDAATTGGGTGPESPPGAPGERAPSDGGSGARADAPVTAADGGSGWPPVPPLPPLVGGSGEACQKDSDCRLVDDCCTCAAIPAADKPPTCDPRNACVMSMCSQWGGGIDQPRCAAGRCILGFDCDASTVTCNRAPPACPAGQVPRVVGGCFGECVEARQCRSVASCAACGRGDLCVRYVRAGAGVHCVAPPSSCAGGPVTCACAAAAVCVAPYRICTGAVPMGGPLSCECPTCS